MVGHQSEATSIGVCNTSLQHRILSPGFFVLVETRRTWLKTWHQNGPSQVWFAGPEGPRRALTEAELNATMEPKKPTDEMLSLVHMLEESKVASWVPAWLVRCWYPSQTWGLPQKNSGCAVNDVVVLGRKLVSWVLKWAIRPLCQGLLWRILEPPIN